MKRTSTYSLRLPASLTAAVAEISRAEGTNMNQSVVMAVAEKVSAMRTAEFLAGRRDAADVEAALRILRREGGQPPNDADTLNFSPTDGNPGVAR